MLFLRSTPRLKQTAFICGCGHSGTTLIATILGVHSQIHVPKLETRLFTTRKGLGGIKTAYRYHRLVNQTRLERKSILIEKTPKHIHKVGLIRRNLPKAKFILPVRDGRDVAASLMKRTGDLPASIQRWVRDTGIIASELGKPDVYVYRHEDLITNSEGVLKEICNFLNVEFEESMLDYHQKPALWHNHTRLQKTHEYDGENHNIRRNWQVNQPIHDTRGRWKDFLNEEDLQEVTSGQGRDLMKLFGYC